MRLGLPMILGVAHAAGCDDDGRCPDGGEPACQQARERMVARQIASRNVDDPRVLAAMRRTPRHRFVPARYRDTAYEDHPLPIGHGQTISQPYIVALMTQLGAVRPGDKVLEIGTGSGYQAAVLAEVGAEVFSLEIVEPLATSSAALLRELGYTKVRVRVGDGYGGWPPEAPFDAVILTAAPPQIPPPLEDQLAVGGRLVAPVGRGSQQLVVLTRTGRGLEQKKVIPVRFVPMTGQAQQ